MNTKSIIPIALSAQLLVLAAQAQNSPSGSGCATNPPDLVNLAYKAANEAVNSEVDSITWSKTRRICPEYVTNLINQIRYGTLSGDNKTLAFYLLGQLRPSDTNSIEFLIQNIDFKATRVDPKLRFPRWSDYPALDALIWIGKPVVEPILAHLAGETNELRRALMCSVLRSGLVLGNAGTVDRLRKRVNEETNPARRKNLGLALKEANGGAP